MEEGRDKRWKIGFCLEMLLIATKSRGKRRRDGLKWVLQGSDHTVYAYPPHCWRKEREMKKKEKYEKQILIGGWYNAQIWHTTSFFVYPAEKSLLSNVGLERRGKGVLRQRKRRERKWDSEKAAALITYRTALHCVEQWGKKKDLTWWFFPSFTHRSQIKHRLRYHILWSLLVYGR